MCPPIPGECLLARTTIAMAFQRIRLLIRRSISRLPGNGGWWSAGMGLIYGVLAGKGIATPSRFALFLSSVSRRRARSGPSLCSTPSRASSHSWVSVVSVSPFACTSRSGGIRHLRIRRAMERKDRRGLGPPPSLYSPPFERRRDDAVQLILGHHV